MAKVSLKNKPVNKKKVMSIKEKAKSDPNILNIKRDAVDITKPNILKSQNPAKSNTTQPVHHPKAKKAEKKRFKVEQHKSASKLPTATLILKNLPPTIDYTQLKGVVPTAKRLELYKKNGKRHAFARFETTENCSSAATKLKHLKLGDYQVRVAFASHSESGRTRSATSADVDAGTTLHISNLPFTITKEKLEEEFPTASQVVMNMNSHGRFRGSCLLHFDSADDCRTVRDACRGRQIDGRPIRCVPGTKFTPREPTAKPKPMKQKIFAVKIKGVPKDIGEDKLRSVVEQHDLLGIVCSVDCGKHTKTVIYKFKSKAAQKLALTKLNRNPVFGSELRARLWSPRRRQRAAKLVVNHSNGEKGTTGSVPSDGESAKLNPKKRRLTEVDEDTADPNTTAVTDDSMLSQTKSKKRKQTKSGDTDASMTDELVNLVVPEPKATGTPLNKSHLNTPKSGTRSNTSKANLKVNESKSSPFNTPLQKTPNSAVKRVDMVSSPKQIATPSKSSKKRQSLGV